MEARSSAILRYRMAVALLTFGILALFGTIPLAIMTWGRPVAMLTLISLGSGLLSLMASVILGAVNLILLKQAQK